jgi:hypothetical protein
VLAFHQFTSHIIRHRQKLSARKVGTYQLNSHSNLSNGIIGGLVAVAEGGSLTDLQRRDEFDERTRIMSLRFGSRLCINSRNGMEVALRHRGAWQSEGP